MFGLFSRALTAFVVCLAIVVGGVWHMAVTWPMEFWLFIVPCFLALFHVEHQAKKRRHAAMDERLRDEHVPSMSPREYEQFVARLLERAGWKVTHSGRVGDQGCDVVAELRGFRAVVQCKLLRKPCGNAAVQQVAASRAHYGAQVMAVVCPAGFTASAMILAASNGVHLMHHSSLPNLAQAARIP